jgi:hypothetical protein
MYCDQPDMQWLASQGMPEATELVKAVKVLDLYLTGKTEGRRELDDLRYALQAIQEGETWVVYLSDGGYSRLVIEPMHSPNGTLIWLNRGLSLDKPKSRAAEIGLSVR